MPRPKFHWMLPTSGDGPNAQDVSPSWMKDGCESRSDFDYMRQIALACDRLGFDGILTPVASHCDDPWVVTAPLARETARLNYMVALRPGNMSPTLAAQMAATFQKISKGRLALNIVSGGDATDLHRYGDWVEHDARYDRTDEFLTVFKGAFAAAGCDFAGDYYRVENARTPPDPQPVPTIYFGGASPAAERVAVKHCDVYMTWGETPEMLAERADRMRELADREGRAMRLGVRLLVISRDSAEQAWAEADRILDAIPDVAVKLAQRRLGRADSAGQQRINSLHDGTKSNLLIAPNLWAGISLVRGHGSTALVGSHDEVAARLSELIELGYEEFILGGLPHLEEAYTVAERVIPLVLAAQQAQLVGHGSAVADGLLV